MPSQPPEGTPRELRPLDDPWSSPDPGLDPDLDLGMDLDLDPAPVARPVWWRWVAVAVIVSLVVATPFAYAMYLVLR